MTTGRFVACALWIFLQVDRELPWHSPVLERRMSVLVWLKALKKPFGRCG